MKPVYLKHPIHGSKVASSEFEVEHDKALGWEVYDPTAKPKPAPVAPVVPVFPETDVPERQTAEEFAEMQSIEPVAPVVSAPEWLVGAQQAAPVAQEPAPKRKGGRPKKSAE